MQFIEKILDSFNNNNITLKNNIITCPSSFTNLIISNIQLFTHYIYNIVYTNDYDLIYLLVYNICTLNMGYNIISNIAHGSEKGMVQYCQQLYNGGWNNNTNISQCTTNAIDYISNFDIIALQEINPKFTTTIVSLLPNHIVYIMNELLIIVRQNMFNNGIIIPGINSIGPDRVKRGLMVVYFPNTSLLVMNLHAPHINDIDYHLSFKLLELDNILDKDITLKRFIIMGDFNDGNKKLLNCVIPFRSLILKQKIKSKTCCHDVNFQLYGDYIFDSYTHSKELESYNFKRYTITVSDHDPASISDKIK